MAVLEGEEGLTGVHFGGRGGRGRLPRRVQVEHAEVGQCLAGGRVSTRRVRALDVDARQVVDEVARADACRRVVVDVEVVGHAGSGGRVVGEDAAEWRVGAARCRAEQCGRVARVDQRLARLARAAARDDRIRRAAIHARARHVEEIGAVDVRVGAVGARRAILTRRVAVDAREAVERLDLTARTGRAGDVRAAVVRRQVEVDVAAAIVRLKCQSQSFLKKRGKQEQQQEQQKAKCAYDLLVCC